MQNILGTLKFYEKTLRVDGAQQFSELMSAIRKFLLPGWGFPAAPNRSSRQDIENAEYALANLPIEKIYDWKPAIERGFDIESKNTKQRSVPRSHVNKFVCWCFKKEILIDPAVGARSHKIRPARGTLVASGRRPNTRRTPVNLDKYILLEEEFTPQLKKEIEEYRRYLEAKHYSKRRVGAVRESTSDIRVQSVCRVLGWLHYHCGISREALSLSGVIRPADLSNMVDAESAAEEFRSWYEGEEEEEGYAQFLLKRGNRLSTIASHLASLTRLVQFQYLGRYADKHGNDIPVMKVVRDLINEYEKAAEDELEPIPIDGKWLDLPELMQKVTMPLFAHTEAKSAYNNLREQNSIASSFIEALLWGLLSLMPPRRSGEWRDCKLATACPINSKPPDLKDGEWIWPLPAERLSKKEIKYGYLTKQYVWQDPATLERFGSYLGTTPPSDRYLERVGVWYKDTPSHAAKSGDSHKYQRVVIMDRVVYQGKSFYDFLEAYIMGYWRDSYGNWVSLGKSADQPGKKFKFYELRKAIAKYSEPISGWLFIGRESGQRYRQGDFGYKIG